MVRLDGMYPYTLIRGKNNRLFRGLSVHPIRRYLFIGDWSSLGQILRTNLDGSNETTILKDVGWPNGITIDFEVKLIIINIIQVIQSESLTVLCFNSAVRLNDAYNAERLFRHFL